MPSSVPTVWLRAASLLVAVAAIAMPAAELTEAQIAAAADGLGGPMTLADRAAEPAPREVPAAPAAQSSRPESAAWLADIHAEQRPGEVTERPASLPVPAEPAALVITEPPAEVRSGGSGWMIIGLILLVVGVAAVAVLRRRAPARPSGSITTTIRLRDRNQPRSGFSLLEVMMALTIMAGALLLVMDNVLVMDKATTAAKENAKVQEMMQVMAERLQGATWFGVGQRTNPWSWHRRDAADAVLPPMTEAAHRLADSFAGANPHDRWGPVGGGSAKSYSLGADQIATPGPANGIPDCYDIIDDGKEVRNGVEYVRYLALHNPAGDLWIWDAVAANRVITGQGSNIITANALPQNVIIRGLGLVSSTGTGLPDVRIYLEYYNMVRDGVGLFDYLNGATITPGLAVSRTTFNANRVNYRLRVKNILQESPATFDANGLNDLDTNDAVVMRLVVRWTPRNGGTAERELVFARRK